MINVFKFGGASVKDADGIKNLAKIIELNKDKRLLIVVSAMGKTTNALEDLTKAYADQRPDMQQIFGNIKTYHQNILLQLFEDENHPVYD